MPGFVDKITKATKETVDRFLDKLPDDDKVIGVADKVLSFFGKKIDTVDKDLSKAYNKFHREVIRDDPSPQNFSEALDDFKKETASFAKDVKNNDFYKKLINFLGATVELITSISKPKELSKAWDNFVKSAQELGKSINKALGSERSR